MKSAIYLMESKKLFLLVEIDNYNVFYNGLHIARRFLVEKLGK